MSLNVQRYPVRVSEPSPRNRQVLLKRVDTMARELSHVNMAVSQLKHALQHHGDTRSLADGVMNSRNWVLSLLISHGFIQTLLNEEDIYSSITSVQTRMMAGEAVQEGMDLARQEHIKKIHGK